MTRELGELGMRYQVNTNRLKEICTDFDETDWMFRPGDSVTPPLWILGHITLHRRIVLRRLGQSLPDEGWENLFQKGSDPNMFSHSPNESPTPGSLIHEISNHGMKITKLLIQLTDEQAAAQTGSELPGASTLRGLIYFLHFHESYHVGQLGYIRRLLGKPGPR